ncbi:MAG TPA: hypothetical protein VL651_02840 [Bacteroidia bacterium]|jgi:hypothetical protein|nr:hypothetical protein [Bacteroidia bacterium]
MAKVFRILFFISAAGAWLLFLLFWLVILYDHWRMPALEEGFKLFFLLLYGFSILVLAPLFCLSSAFVLSKQFRNKNYWILFCSVLIPVLFFWYLNHHDLFCFWGCIID